MPNQFLAVAEDDIGHGVPPLNDDFEATDEPGRERFMPPSPHLSATSEAATLVFNMVRTCTMPLTDAELRLLLESGEAILFVGREISLHTIERQVERLGFGDAYIVSATQARQTEATRIQVKPFAAAA